MRHALLLVSLLLLISSAQCAGRPGVATFSKDDLSRLTVEGCGPQASPRRAVRLHRNISGNMVYAVSEGHSESIIYAQTQNCNPISSDTLDLWRNEQGEVTAQLSELDGQRRLVVGQAEMRGKRFDVERSGQYMVISHGASSSIGAIAKPYRKLYDVGLDAQRIFVRKKALLIVGDNTATGKLEARQIRIEAGTFSEDPPIAIGEMPAGVKVLDYAEGSDDLLLGGVTATGETSFVVFNVGSQKSATVNAAKPGDDGALFISDSRLRSRISGGRSAPPQEEKRKSSWPFKKAAD